MSSSNKRRAPTRRLVLVALLVLAAALHPRAPRAAEGDTSLAAELVAAFDRVFKGPYDGERAIHTKGIVVRGSFTADPDAMSLSTAEHLRADAPPVPVIVRFSDFSGVPSQIDGQAGTSPTGMAIKFQLSNGVDTDIVAHSYNGFPVATPQDFLGYVTALAANDPKVRDDFLASHPAARQFVDDPKPTPVSYGTETYFGVDAFRFTNAAAVARFGRYRIEPIAGAQHLSAAEAAAIKPNYLRDQLQRRLNSGPVRFRLIVQLAGPDDAVVDPSTPWPADRPEIILGVLSLTQVVPDTGPEIRTLFFSPMNLVPGIAASADPLLAARTRSYAISYRRRLSAE
jgi:catalase